MDEATKKVSIKSENKELCTPFYDHNAMKLEINRKIRKKPLQLEIISKKFC